MGQVDLFIFAHLFVISFSWYGSVLQNTNFFSFLFFFTFGLSGSCEPGHHSVVRGIPASVGRYRLSGQCPKWNVLPFPFFDRFKQFTLTYFAFYRFDQRLARLCSTTARFYYEYAPPHIFALILFFLFFFYFVLFFYLFIWFGFNVFFFYFKFEDKTGVTGQGLDWRSKKR